MEHLFLKIINMSITAGWLVLAIMVLRLLLKKAPKAIVVALWVLVCIRLVCPYSFESVLSLVPSSETIPKDIVYAYYPEIESGISAVDSAINPIISESLMPNIGDSVNPVQIILIIGSWIWCAGIIGMLLYAVISYLRVHRSVREAAPFWGNVWLCDRISTPFILGIVRPHIYLPSSMNKQDMEYVIAHEKAHLKRLDHIWKPLGFVLLAVYWFNPLIWFAYIFLCKDIELACDEKVIKDMGLESKRPYSEALINLSVPRRMVNACPLAFGETGVKTRIKAVLAYRKPAWWVIMAAVIVCVVAGVSFLSNPKGQAGDVFVRTQQSTDIKAGTVVFFKSTVMEYSVWNGGVIDVKCKGMFTEEQLKEFCSVLEEQKWVFDALVDRIEFNFDGCVYYDGDWIHFGYRESIIQYKDYFCRMPDEVRDMLRALEKESIVD